MRLTTAQKDALSLLHTRDHLTRADAHIRTLRSLEARDILVRVAKGERPKWRRLVDYSRPGPRT